VRVCVHTRVVIAATNCGPAIDPITIGMRVSVESVPAYAGAMTTLDNNNNYY
jgi:hypothetical protein